ncbi:hypothetical protein [Novosphingobium sp. ERW19]|uniref:hypothetical protein n=1 Tax=Novosphingobium sp. ERW19 TaxID=2726186 RepID=UPI001F0D1113|nr:hypothetical protein [Novosphingobium sp. ERW19]
MGVRAALGGELGKAFDGKRLFLLSGLLMIGVGLSMLRKRRTAEASNVRLTRDSAATLLPRLIPTGLRSGLLPAYSELRADF